MSVRIYFNVQNIIYYPQLSPTWAKQFIYDVTTLDHAKNISRTL